MNFTLTNSRLLRSFKNEDIWFITCFFLFAAWIFREHLFGSFTFLGNPDRVHNNLKIVRFYVDSISSGLGLQAWNERELLGYDSFSLPYISPNPLIYIFTLFSNINIFVIAGYISASLLGLSGVASYLYIREVTNEKLSAFTAASLYMLASITTLKASQNDASFFAFILMPLLMLAVRRTLITSIFKSLIIQTTLLYLLLQFSFIQKASYIIILWITYSIFTALNLKQPKLLLITFGALIISFIASFPRILGVLLATHEFTRGRPGEGLYPVISNPLEFLRLFDGTIFGRYFGDKTWSLNRVNLSEGFLLFTTCFTPFIFVIVDKLKLYNVTKEDRFFRYFVLCIFLTILDPWIMQLVWFLYAKIDFIHSRILIIALLPMLTIIAIQLSRLSTGMIFDINSLVFGFIIGFIIFLTIEFLSSFYIGPVYFSNFFKFFINNLSLLFEKVAPLNWTVISLESSALIRISASGFFVFFLIYAIVRFDNKRLCTTLYVALLSVMINQAISGSNFQFNNSHSKIDDSPFLFGNISWVKSFSFDPPTDIERKNLNELLDTNNFRSFIICDRRIAGGFCAAHYSEFWKLRLIDGYFGFGVPSRLASIPLKSIGLRDLSFTNTDDIPWSILGFLNVKFGLYSSPSLYGYGLNDSRVNNAIIISNPENIVPRAFFARSIVPVRTKENARDKIFYDNAIADVTVTSFVEGSLFEKKYDSQGIILFEGSGDLINLNFEPIGATRFLIINELFNPNWSAFINGKEVPLYATNVVMRGVEIPAEANRVTLKYKPVNSLYNNLLSVIIAITLLFLFRFFIQRIQTRIAT